MAEVDAVVRLYGLAWLSVDEGERRRLLDLAWSEAGVYQDPQVDISGRDALVRHIAAFHSRSPGSKVVITSSAQHHHGRFHFTWALVGRDGVTALEGRDFGELDEDGRIRLIVGFFGAPPPARTADR